MIKLSQFEKEIRLRFDDGEVLNHAINHCIECLPVLAPSIFVKRPTIYLDTRDRRLLTNGHSLSFVLHSGLTESQHKLVHKQMTDKTDIRSEEILISTNSGTADIGELLSSPLVSEIVQPLNICTKELKPILITSQERRKYTITFNEHPIFLSFDKVSYRDPRARQLLAQRFFLEIEDTETSIHQFIKQPILRCVAQLFSEIFPCVETRLSKLEIGLSIVDNIDSDNKQYADYANDLIPSTFNRCMCSDSAQERRNRYKAQFETLNRKAFKRINYLSAQAIVYGESTVQTYKRLIKIAYEIKERLLPTFHKLHLFRKSKFQLSSYSMADVQFEPGISTKEISFETAFRSSIATLSKIINDKRMVEDVIKHSHFDVLPHTRKSTSSFTTFSYSDACIHLYWQSNLNSSADLVHEYGHVLHHYLCDGYAKCPQYIKETFAIYTEEIGLQYLPNARTPFYLLERWRAMFFRPLYLSQFETIWNQIHTDDTSILDNEYSKLLQLYYGPALTTEYAVNEWKKIDSLGSFERLPYAVSFLLSAVLFRKNIDSKQLFTISCISDLSDIAHADIFSIKTYDELICEYIKLANAYMKACKDVKKYRR